MFWNQFGCRMCYFISFYLASCYGQICFIFTCAWIFGLCLRKGVFIYFYSMSSACFPCDSWRKCREICFQSFPIVRRSSSVRSDNLLPRLLDLILRLLCRCFAPYSPPFRRSSALSTSPPSGDTRRDREVCLSGWTQKPIFMLPRIRLWPRIEGGTPLSTPFNRLSAIAGPDRASRSPGKGLGEFCGDAIVEDSQDGNGD